MQLKVGCPNFDPVRDSAIYPSFYSVPKLQSCLGVRVENVEDDESRKCGGKCGINNNLCRTLVISVNCGFGDGVMTVANAKSSPESGKFALQIISESGKLLTIGCHFPSKSINFGTPSFYLRNIRRRNGQKSYKKWMACILMQKLTNNLRVHCPTTHFHF